MKAANSGTMPVVPEFAMNGRNLFKPVIEQVLQLLQILIAASWNIFDIHRGAFCIFQWFVTSPACEGRCTKQTRGPKQ